MQRRSTKTPQLSAQVTEQCVTNAPSYVITHWEGTQQLTGYAPTLPVAQEIAYNLQVKSDRLERVSYVPIIIHTREAYNQKVEDAQRPWLR